VTDEALRALERDEATTRSAASAAALARALARAGRPADAYVMACRALRRDPASDVRDLLPASLAHDGIAPRGPELRARRVPVRGLSGRIMDAGRGFVACEADGATALVDVTSASVRWRVPGPVRLLCASGEQLVTWTRLEDGVALQLRDQRDGALRASLPRPASISTDMEGVQLADGTIAWLLVSHSQDESRLVRVDLRGLDVLAECSFPRHVGGGFRPRLVPLPGGGALLCGRDGLHALGPDLRERWRLGRERLRIVGLEQETLTLVAHGDRMTAERVLRLGADGSFLGEVTLDHGLVASGIAFHGRSGLVLLGRTTEDDLQASAVVVADAVTGHVLWRLERPSAPGLVVARDRLIVWDSDGLEVLDSSTGERVARLAHPIRGSNAGATTAAGAVVIDCRGDRGGHPSRSGLLLLDDDLA
jgi:phage host-nuclease inhibitor protein Gam